jgi:hypothetical protein
VLTRAHGSGWEADDRQENWGGLGDGPTFSILGPEPEESHHPSDGCVAKLRVEYRRSHIVLIRITSGGDPEKPGDEFTLSFDVVSVDASNLSLSDHHHRLKTRQGSSRRPEPAKAELRSDQPFDTPVILLDDVVLFRYLTRPGTMPKPSPFISVTACG